MPTMQDVATRYKAAPDGGDLVERVVARSLRISLDPTTLRGSGVRELAVLAGHDRSILGDAWLELVVPALRNRNAVVMAAERLLSEALESEGSCERVHTGLVS
jgi:hypothetical protein